MFKTLNISLLLTRSSPADSQRWNVRMRVANTGSIMTATGTPISDTLPRLQQTHRFNLPDDVVSALRTTPDSMASNMTG